MKGIFFSTRLFFVIVLIILSLSTRANDGFVLRGKLAGAKKGTTIYLIQDRTKDTIAKAKVSGEKFIFKGEVPDGTEYFYLRIDSALNHKRSREFLLVNAIQHLETSLADWPKVILDGSQPHKDYLNLVSLWESIGGAETKEDKATRLEKIRGFVLQHSSSLYIPDLIRRMMREFTLDEVNKMYLTLSEESKNGYFGKLLTRDLDLANKRKNIRQGTTVPSFDIKSLDGSVIDIKEAIGKNEFTLIDFWASWCKPCREEVPNLKKVYAKHRDKGFGIVGVALSDKKDNWKKAIEEDGANWLHGWDSANRSYKIFDIPAIPGFALVDRSGKLISFNCSGSAIPEFGPPIKGEALFTTIDSLLHFSKNLKNDSLTALKIGDMVPDISIGKIAGNKGGNNLKVSDFRGKLLILDFWSTSCIICIKQFPKIHALQETFGDKIAIVPVGFQYKNGEIEQFLEKSKGTQRELKLISTIQAAGDHTMEKLFPFFGLPHEVWIDANGKLIGLTDYRAVTSDNIESILAGNVPEFSVRKRRSITVQDFILLKDKDRNSHVIGSSFVKGFVDTLSSISTDAIRLNNDSSNLYYQGFNNTIFKYYIVAYAEFFKKYRGLENFRILIDSSEAPFYKDWGVTSGMDNWQYSEFERNNLFSYELKLPASFGLKYAQEYMVKSLDNYLQIKSRIEKRKFRCLVLQKRPGKDLLQNNPYLVREKRDEEGNSNASDYVQFYGDEGITRLIGQLVYLLPTQRLIIDETGYAKNIHITIDKKKGKDVKGLKSELAKYGLDLIEAEREIEMLVLKKYED